MKKIQFYNKDRTQEIAIDEYLCFRYIINKRNGTKKYFIGHNNILDKGILKEISETEFKQSSCRVVMY